MNDSELSMSELMSSEAMEKAAEQAERARLDENTRPQEPLRAAEADANEGQAIVDSESAAKAVIIGHLDEDGNPIVPSFETVSYSDLMSREFDELWQPVEGLIAEGLTVLVGGSKMGKSWLCLDMACSVAAGTPFLGRRTSQCPVLYLALEDSLRRLQDRIRKQGQIPGRDSFDLSFATISRTLDDGFEEQLERWMHEHGGKCLVIVDVLQKVSGATSRRDGNAYQAGFKKAAMIKAIADRYKAAVIVVHHTKRGKEEDPFDMVSGGNGLMAAADATMIMTRKRGESYADIQITGRDVQEDLFTIQMDESMRWHIAVREEPPTAYDYNPYVMAIKAIVRDNPDGTRLCFEDFLSFAYEEIGHAIARQKTDIRPSIEAIQEELLRRDHIKVDLTPANRGEKPSLHYKLKDASKTRTKNNPCPCVTLSRWVCRDEAEQLSLPQEGLE